MYFPNIDLDLSYAGFTRDLQGTGSFPGYATNLEILNLFLVFLNFDFKTCILVSEFLNFTCLSANPIQTSLCYVA